MTKAFTSHHPLLSTLHCSSHRFLNNAQIEFAWNLSFIFQSNRLVKQDIIKTNKAEYTKIRHLGSVCQYLSNDATKKDMIISLHMYTV